MTALDELATIPFHDADAPQRARMLSRLADTELIVALGAEPVGDDVELRMFPLEDGQVALACDTEDRLSDFFGQPVHYIGLPGRVLAGLLRAEGAGLLVNPGHPSEMLLDAAMLDWLTGALAATPQEDLARLRLTAAGPRHGGCAGPAAGGAAVGYARADQRGGACGCGRSGRRGLASVADRGGRS